jgi:hypothetical protein
MVIGCGDKGADDTGATTKTTMSGADGAAEMGAEDTGNADGTTGNVDPSSPTGEGPTGNPSSSPTSDPTTGTPDETEGPGTATEATFILNPDGGGATCDVFAQDCPDGQKCTAWASDGGGSWNATKCVPVTGDKVPGDECTVEGSGVTGIDNCEKGAMCWDTDEMNIGLCVELCKGSEEAPTCSTQGFTCSVTNEGVLTLCLPGCDPLLQDCPGNDVCIPIGDGFVCVLDASGEEGQAFDPCEFANTCDPGLVCAGSASANECSPMAMGCCVPMCSISEMAPCPGAGQECTSLFEEGQAPPAFTDVGYCTIPA